MRDLNEIVPEITIGMDLGDKYSFFSIIERGEDTFREQGRVRTTAKALEAKFRRFKGARIAIETGTHSPWVSRLLENLGLEVFVANARKLRQIYERRLTHGGCVLVAISMSPQVRPSLSASSAVGRRLVIAELICCTDRDAFVGREQIG